MAKLLTLAEAAAELGVTIYAVRRASDRGTLRTSLFGPIRVVTAAEVDRYRREHLGQVGRPKKKR